MYWQIRELKSSKAFDSSTTGLETVDLPKTGLLAGLTLRVWGTNGSTAGKPDIWLHDRMKKIEIIVNGSRVIKSFEGTQLLADMLYKGIVPMSHDAKNIQNASAEEMFHICFGRHYHDTMYMLDLGAFNDPELRIDYDFGMTSANGWSNGVAMASAPSFTLLAHILRDAPEIPAAHIKTSEVARFTSGASKKENMKLPLGPMYANLYLQSFYASQGLGYLLDKIEVNIDNDRSIPVSMGFNELLAHNVRQYGLFKLMQQTSLKGGQAYPMPLEQGQLITADMGLVAYVPQYLDLWGQANSMGFKDISTGLTPYTGTLNIAFTILGALPYSVAAIPGFDLKDDRTWVDTKELGDMWLRVEENSSGGTSATIKLLADEVQKNA